MREYSTTIIGAKKRPQFHDESGAPAPLSNTGGINMIESNNSRAGGNLIQGKKAPQQHTPKKPKPRAPAATKKKTVVKTKSRSPTRIQRRLAKSLER
jgi:hypothetical protein